MRVVYLILAIAVGLASPVLAQEHVTEPAAAPRDAQEQAVQVPAPQTLPVPTTASSTAPSAAEQNGDAGNGDRQVDETSHMFLGDGWAQWVMALLSLVGVFISGWAVWLLKKTLDATVAAIREGERTTAAALEANEIMRRDQRPWLDFKVIEFGRWQAIHRDGHISSALCFPKVMIVNEGQSPAIDARFEMKIYSGKSFDSDDIPELMKGAMVRKSGGRMIFPAKDFIWEKWGAGHAVEDASQTSVENPNAILQWYLVCFVTYWFENKMFSTVKVFSFGAPNVADLENDEMGHPRWFAPDSIHHIPWLDEYT